jgi:signal transduction histidine kinase
MGFERHHSALIVASAITVASFVGATAYTQNRLARLDSLSSTLETNAVPSVDLLSRAALRLTRLGQLLDDIAARGARRADALNQAHSELRALEADVQAYIRLPPLPGERAFWAALRDAVSHAVEDVKSVLARESGREPASPPPDWNALDDDVDAAVESVAATLQYDVKQCEILAGDIRQVRATTARMIVQLDSVATTIAFIAVVIAYRASRRHDHLQQEHSALLADRVTELDRFAGRVAHDVLSPLGTIATALPLLSRSADADERTYIDRSRRALQRVEQLVDGLLTFARSGARPDPTSVCSVDAALANVVADCTEAAREKGIDLVLETEPSLQALCTVGVITSIADNLVRNAIKYMGSRDVLRIVVRCRARGPAIRIEVEDTGPGIPAEARGTLFEPFVRGTGETVSGVGLGLATVKRLVEAHGGAVGLQSTVGMGSVFWVELPSQPRGAKAAPDPSSGTVSEGSRSAGTQIGI